MPYVQETARDVYVIGSYPSPEVVSKALAAKIGDDVVAISSDNRRFVEQARETADKLGIDKIHESQILHNGGVRPEGIGDLDEFLERVLDQAGVELRQNQDILLFAPNSLARAVDEGGIPENGLPVEQSDVAPVFVPVGDLEWDNKAHDEVYETGYLH